MISYRFADSFAETNGNRVTNQAANGFHTVFTTRFNELVVFRKRLENGSFAQRDRAVLRRMTETSITKSKKLRRDCGSRFVPFHPAIHAGVGLAGFFPVT